MDEIEKELTKATRKVVTDVAEDLVRPTSKSVGENIGLLVDGVIGSLGYWDKSNKLSGRYIWTNIKSKSHKR